MSPSILCAIMLPDLILSRKPHLPWVPKCNNLLVSRKKNCFGSLISGPHNLSVPISVKVPEPWRKVYKLFYVSLIKCYDQNQLLEERVYLAYGYRVGIHTVEEGSQTRKLRDQISPHKKPRGTCSKVKTHKAVLQWYIFSSKASYPKSSITSWNWATNQQGANTSNTWVYGRHLFIQTTTGVV